jgi:hypothetical protein
MLEVFMSVWPNSVAIAPALKSSEGALISISVSVEPRLLEELLEALAQLQFPINPQIYHDAAVRYIYADGREEIYPTTLVDFPAYAGWLPEIRRVLEMYGFATDALQVNNMLEEIHAESSAEPAPSGAPYVRRVRVKHFHTPAAH